MTMVMLAMINIARQIDDKVRRQNAVDAATRSAAGTLARGMNQIAFANHLEADIFAIAAILYGLEGSNTPWTAQYAPLRPLFEQMLVERSVSEYRWDVIRTTPQLARFTMGEITRRHGLTQAALQAEQGSGMPGSTPSTLNGILWTNRSRPLAENPDAENSFETRTLPVIDLEGGHDFPVDVPGGPLPTPYDRDQAVAITRRNQTARNALQNWIWELERAYERLPVDPLTNMPPPVPRQIIDRARDRLDELLETLYPTLNVPAMLRPDGADPRYFEYVGVVYGQHREEMAPRMYRSPLRQTATPTAFAQVRVFLPVRQLRYYNGASERLDGAAIDEEGWDFYVTDRGRERRGPFNNNNGWPQRWDTFSQNWTVQLVPATSPTIPQILQTPPADAQGNPVPGIQMPNLAGTDWRQFNLINTH